MCVWCGGVWGLDKGQRRNGTGDCTAQVDLVHISVRLASENSILVHSEPGGATNLHFIFHAIY